MKRLYSLTVRGKGHEWSFALWADPGHAEDWHLDGLIVDEIQNTIPMWVVDIGLTRPWCWLQDIGVLPR